MSASIEPLVAQWGNEQLHSLGWDRSAPEQISVDAQIDEALKNNPSKKGGEGGGRPDYTIIMSNGNSTIPVLIEYKGSKGKLIKKSKDGLVSLRNSKGFYDFKSSIPNYAVNGASYYASSVVKDTDYGEVLAVGVNGYRLVGSEIVYEVSCFLISKNNPDVPLFFGEYSDLSFLNSDNFDNILRKIVDIQTDPEELHKKALLDDKLLDSILKKLNQHLRNESRIRVGQRIFIVAASIMAALGVKDNDNNYVVSPLSPSNLTGSIEDGETDGDKILNKAENFLKARNLPEMKKKQIINSLRQTLIYSNLQLMDDNGLSPIKSAYKEVYDNVIPAFNMTGTIDFTGKLFNVMNDWVDVPDGDANDVVLTPRYVTNLMARLAQVDMNSYVWDWALGSGGFLISAMNLMIDDAKNRISSPKEFFQKNVQIKTQQLLGVEKLPDIYILAVLNMILMGDGSSNIINENSLTQFNGNYAYGENNDKKFPANVFLLNPPYSAKGNGMIFVLKALEQMDSGYAAVIVQDSAGSGRATEFNKSILKNNRLIASIKMPADLFKATVQTSIYLFHINKMHESDDIVKFIDFRNDGYKRANRKKSSNNLQDTGTAHARYKELVDIVKNGAKNATFYKEGESYFEDTIDPEDGNDWNLEKHQVINMVPSSSDFKDTVSKYISWEVSQLLRKGN